MGWWWTSSSQKNDQQNTTNNQSSTTSLSSSRQEPSKPPTTRDEQADSELREFLASLDWTGDSDKKSNTNSSPPPTTTTTTESPSPASHATFFQALEEGKNDSSSGGPKSIAPESLYPDEMSCRSAFDYAFFCQSFGGQWVNIYRYGELRSCSEHWENFWLCMKARSYPDNIRKKTIRDHYRKKAIKYKTGPSSEDVWDVRTEPLTNPFQGDFAAYEKEEQATAQR